MSQAGQPPVGGQVETAASVDGDAQHHRAFDPRFVELLVCPLTRTTLAYDAARQELVSRAARVAFPIRDGMPILVREEARHLDDVGSPRHPTS